MSIWFYLFLGLAVLFLINLYFSLIFIRKVLKLDEVFSYMEEDIIKNVESIDKMTQNKMVSNFPEIKQIHEMFIKLGNNLRQYAYNIEENTFKGKIEVPKKLIK